MLTVTKKASEMIKDALKNQTEPLVIRIFMQNGCCGSSLRMAMGELKKSDVTFTDQGIQYVIEKDLFEEIKPVKVDFVDAPGGSGFRLTSNLHNRTGAGGGCCG
ncbi:IscA/HesB family protein [Desulfoferrobacter suflitae]|uniref:IscA/HesB family protein n=1 Tax=Desulfoferrobacter suflitae TaxID=2865782 RepID=UPI00216420D3|nr:IscA/HesB family protein [Desulfoferrobacter suflitae]MCK8603694.1 IscA/HesB family protein [Desulfoferrobacter suflitae]